MSGCKAGKSLVEGGAEMKGWRGTAQFVVRHSRRLSTVSDKRGGADATSTQLLPLNSPLDRTCYVI